jgi:lipid II isoglutaminyl synthase (glutamine-hydrolysing)
MNQQIFISHLYPKEMSIYGDMGNILAMKFRLQEYGFDVIYQTVGQGQDLPEKTDWYFMGGGQDKEQEIIYKDLLTKKIQLKKEIENGVGLLAICGGYQLLGKSFLTGNGKQVEGIGLFDVETKAPGNATKDRCIGNIITECMIPELKGEKLIGFENHGGQTEFLSQKISKPLGKVLIGKGNNGKSEYEGCVYQHAIGTYLHGSCLPKNPALCDWFIQKILEKKNQTLHDRLGNEIEEAVRQGLFQRFERN